MHTIRFRLKLAEYEKQELNKRFRIVWHMHNETVSFAQKRLNLLSRDRQYIDAMNSYVDASKKLKAIGKKARKGKDIRTRMAALSKQKKEASAILNARISFYGLTKTDFDRFVSVMQKKNSKLISSQQAQKEAERVLAGVEKVLYGNGKHVRMKRLSDQKTISQKCATNGVKIDLSSGIATWGEMSMHMDIDFSDLYVRESLSGSLKYATIQRLPFQNGYHYYVILTLDGPAPRKTKVSNKDGMTGIDPGMSTIAAASEQSVVLEELAPKAKAYEKQIARQQRLVDADMRRDNPDNYKADGTIKKGKHKWVLSKGCLRRKQKIRVLNRKKTASTKDSHNKLINKLIEKNGPYFIAEEMDYAALKKRSKAKAQRRTTPAVIKQKDGTEKTIFKYKRKRRFGCSVNSRSPGLFLIRLAQKAQIYGGDLAFVNTREFRASQYRHDTKKYIKVPLSDRWKTIEDHKVQRDLYSAFLILCSDVSGKAPDNDKCNALFQKFVLMHDQFVSKTKSMPHPACFGY